MNLRRFIGIARLAILAFVVGVVFVGVARAQTPPPMTTAERAAFYDKLANEKSTKAVEQLVREAMSAKPDVASRFVIDALLERYFELDAVAAVRFAAEQGNAAVVEKTNSLYARLARTNPNAALTALSLVDDASVAQGAAAAIFEVLGKNLATVDLVAGALHGKGVDRFRAYALSYTAIPPREALTAAVRLRDPEMRAEATASIIRRWAEAAPRDAMEAAERLQDPAQRTALRRSVLMGWRDTVSLMTYLTDLNDAERRAAIGDGVLYRLAEADPERAAVFVQSLPPGIERSGALQQIAVSYSQKDATAALKWAQRLDPPQLEVVTAVIRTAASRDALRAFDLVGSLPEPARMQAYYAVIGSGFARDQSQFEQLAARIATVADGQNKQSMLQALLGTWAQSPGNAKPALEWAIAHSADLPPDAFLSLGYALAQSDVEAALPYLDRVPAAARPRWIGAIAFGYMRSDPQRAVAFVERFRGDPAYDGAALALAPQLASVDPAAASRLLTSVTTRPQSSFGTEMQIAQQWAQRDPQAAANWALDLPQPQRNMAVSMVGMAWGQSNPSAARSWALGLPAGEKRDVALSAALRAQGPGAPDPALVAAFSDDRARQGALMATIMTTAARDAPLARQLIEEHITDPRLRSQAVDMVDNAARGGVQLPTMGVRSPVIGMAVPTGVQVGPTGVVVDTISTAGGFPPGVTPSFSTGQLPIFRQAPPPAPASDAPSTPAK